MGEKVEVVLQSVAKTCGEGPHWDVQTQSLYFVDAFSCDIHRWFPLTKEKSDIHLDEQVSIVIPTNKNDYIVTQSNKLCKLNWENHNVELLQEVGKSTNFNDGKCDASGRLFVGSLGKRQNGILPEEAGSLYCYHLDGSLQEQADKITLSNGMAWTSDSKNMFYADSIKRLVYLFDYDLEKGQTSNQRILLDFSKYEHDLGVPDGMTMDTQDKLWVVCYNAGKVVRFDPETAKVLQEVKIGAIQTTSCCFGGPYLDELYVTSAKENYTEEEFRTKDPLAGSLFKVTGLGVKGYPANNYQG